MKSARLLLFAFLAGFACFILIACLTRKQNEARMRAELHMLDAIKNGVSVYLERGSELPASWIVLSNAVKWDLVAGISEYNKLPPPTEGYTVLSQSMTGKDHYGTIFLVGSKPFRRSGFDRTRKMVP